MHAAYSVVLPIRSAPTLHNKINFHAGILRKLQIERLVLEKLENATGFEMDFVLDYSHLSCHSVDYYHGKHCNTNRWFVGIAFVRHKSIIDYFPIAHNTLCLPPKFCITYCLKMLLGKCNTPRSI